MATHSTVLAWRIPGTGEPGGLQSLWGRTESGTTEVTQHEHLLLLLLLLSHFSHVLLCVTP